MFIETLIIMAKEWKHPKCLLRETPSCTSSLGKPGSIPHGFALHPSLEVVERTCGLAARAVLVLDTAGRVEAMLTDEELLELAGASRVLFGPESSIWETSEKL
ncbi:unnamed protein product [Rangifer tarandus platyrhynchus]|uniref:Uncharacterized protein n=2 Tax=Rangifer tarandus platyrhynchus TaxID=3082113 RepID=A0ABN8ZSH2_RANTA|nr:unnamed protein product [Rangifer tarandus platyrhynchus]